MKPYIVPIAGDFRITQKFGESKLDYSKLGLKYHNGIDLAANRGTPLIAPTAGQIALTHDDVNGYGNDVWLLTPTDNSLVFNAHVFGHLLSFSVTEGQTVEQGEYLGAIDSTGFSTGDHLHWGVKQLRRLTGTETAQYIYNWLGNTYEILDYENGVYGCYDFSDDVEGISQPAKTPVEQRYGQSRSISRETSFTLSGGRSYAIYRAKKTGVYSDGWWEKAFNALVYGYWNIEVVLAPELYALWAYNTKPAYEAYLKDRKVVLNKPVPIIPK